MKNKKMQVNKAEQERAFRPAGITRRRVLKISALVGVSLPLIVTLHPLEARAQGTEGS